MAEEIEKDRLTAVTFVFTRSLAFRAVHAAGAWGGITPDGHIFMDFYTEHAPLPDEITHGVKDDGTLGEETARKPLGDNSHPRMIREVQAEVILGLDAAVALRTWLDERIALATKATEERVTRGRARRDN